VVVVEIALVVKLVVLVEAVVMLSVQELRVKDMPVDHVVLDLKVVEVAVALLKWEAKAELLELVMGVLV
jgi:hypothetical protein